MRVLTFSGETYLGNIKPIIKEIEDSPKEPFSMLFSSPGGNVDDGILFYNFLRLQTRPLVMIASSSVASSGIYPFLAADDRRAFPGTTFFIHALTLEMSGRFDVEFIRERVSLLEADIKRCRDILRLRTKMKDSDIDDMFRYGRVLTVEDALGFGIIHEVQALR